MEQQEQRKKRLRAALQMAEAIRKEARHFVDLPPGMRPEKLTGAGKQFNELVNWLQQELDIRLPIVPLPDDPDPSTLALAATQLVGALQIIIGEEIAEEPKERRREPVLKIREQKSPVEFSEIVITSAEELAELIRTGVPEWIKTIVAKATSIAEKAVSETEKEFEARATVAQKVVEETEPEASLSERLEELGELIDDLTEELAEVEGELAEAESEGYLTYDLKAHLEAKRAKLKQRLKEALNALQRALGE